MGVLAGREHHGGGRIQITCDDLGYHPSINRAIVAILSRGVVRRASIMASGPHFADAVDRLMERGIDAVGVHLTLTGEYPNLPVRPLSAPGLVPSLVDERGCFSADVSRLAGAVELAEVEGELELQIERVRSTGLRLTHLDGHMFFYERNVGGVELFGMVNALALRHGLPLRVAREGGEGEAARGTVRQVWDEAHGVAQRIRLYRELFAGGAPDVTELIIHPADDPTGLASFSTTGKRRYADYVYFSSEEFPRALERSGISIANEPRASDALPRR